MRIENLTSQSKNLLPDEKLIISTKKHIIIFFFPLVWTIFSLYAFAYMRTSPILSVVAWAPWLVAIIFWAYTALEYFTSDFVVTNKRVIMREGFFTKHTTELRLSAISQVHIDQSLLGQVFDYGSITLNAMGTLDKFTLVAQPNTLQNAINEQLK